MAEHCPTCGAKHTTSYPARWCRNCGTIRNDGDWFPPAERAAMQAELARLRELVKAAYEEGYNLGGELGVPVDPDWPMSSIGPWERSNAKRALEGVDG